MLHLDVCDPLVFEYRWQGTRNHWWQGVERLVHCQKGSAHPGNPGDDDREQGTQIEKVLPGFERGRRQPLPKRT